MAGYAGFSKSNNAIEAEASGKFPASVLARQLHVKTAAIKALMTPDERHHTSKRYNATDYYDGAALLVIAGKANEADFNERNSGYGGWLDDEDEALACRLHGRWETERERATELLEALRS